VRTVARRGYEFSAQVGVSDEGEGPGFIRASSSVAAPRASGAGRRMAAALGMAVGIAVIVAAAILYLRSPAGADAPPPLSLVVMPLANLTGEAEQEYFAAAITNDLTTDLARVRNSLVIARSTADTYRGKSVDTQAVGRELGVRYLVEGSVYRHDETVQVNVRLVEAETGRLLWSERSEGQRKDLGSLQQRVADGIVHTLRVEMIDADVARSLRERPGNPDARDLEMRGWVQWNRQTPESVEEARRLLLRATELDPGSVEAWIRLSSTYTADLLNRWLHLRGHTREEWLERFRDAAAHAHALNPSSTRPIPPECTALMFERKHEESLACRKRVLELFPSDPVQYLMAANTLIFLGRPRDALVFQRHALRLSPRDSRLASFHGSMSGAHFMLRDYEASLAEARLAVTIRPGHAQGHSLVAAAASQLGDLPAARIALAEYLRLQPGYTVAALRAEHWSDNPVFLEGRERFYEALRKAGLPD
jgi:TolB-like protein